MKNGKRTLMVLAVACLASNPIAALGQQPKSPPPGSLSGTVTTADKRPINNTTTLLVSGVFVDLQEYRFATVYNPDDLHFSRGPLGDAQNASSRQSTDLKMSGLYTFKNLRPGIYNLLVEAGQITDTHYRPQRIIGVVIKPGQETVLDITMHPGDTLEQIGDPKGNTQAGLKKAWIEGTVTTPEGLPVFNTRTLIVSGVVVTLKKTTGEQAVLPTDQLAGGFFSAANLLPGTYELTVEKGSRPGNMNYRPLMVANLEIKPGQRTVLNLVMHPGEGLERIAAPPLKTQAIQVSAR